MCSLIQKYNVPGPRYTSYPTVPYWDTSGFSGQGWKESVSRSFEESNETEGISLYVHLPFCEHMCTFCGCHKRITKRHELELPYIMSVLKEWELYRELLEGRPRISELHLGGGTPTFFSAENLAVLIKGLLHKSDLTDTVHFSFEGHPASTSKEHLKVLYDFGFRSVSFGVQDYNENVQRAINRIQTLDQVCQVTDWAREIGYNSVGHDLIYGLPKQDADHVRQTMKMTSKLQPDRIAFYSYAHVPWKKGNGQRGYKDEDLPGAEQKAQQYEQGKALLLDAGYYEIGMDHFALEDDPLFLAMNQGYLHRNFMGYTTSVTQLMIGLGVSSISDSWYGFAQNEKSLEAYQHLVDSRIIPIYRGHLLSEEDQFIRRHILNLMCRYETNWQTDHRTDLRENIIRNLEEMIRDGMVRVSDQDFKVTKKGKPFIRNICMAFDLRLQQRTPQTQLFSMTV